MSVARVGNWLVLISFDQDMSELLVRDVFEENPFHSKHTAPLAVLHPDI